MEIKLDIEIDNYIIIAVLLLLILVPLISWLIVFRWMFRLKRDDMKNRVVLITGAGSGVGRELALQFIDRGVKRLVLLDINAVGLEESKNILQKEMEKKSRQQQGGQGQKRQKEKSLATVVQTFVCDITDEGAVENVYKNLVEKPTILIQNAGIVSGKSFVQLSVEEFRRTMEVNSIAHFTLFKTFFVPLIVTEAKDQVDSDVLPPILVTIGSLMSVMGAAKLTDYAASKHAAHGLHESIRLELLGMRSQKGVIGKNARNARTLMVCPYVIDTGMFKGIYQGSFWNKIISTFFPFLNKSYVAKRIVLAIERGESYLILPEYLRLFVALIQVFPVYAYDIILGLMGAVHGMDTFKGRNDKAKKKKDQ